MRGKAVSMKRDIIAKATERNGIKLFTYVGKAQPDAMKDVAFQLKGETSGSFVFVAGIADGAKCTLMVMLSDDLVADGLNAGKLVKDAARHIQGGGGGPPHFATAGGKLTAGDRRIGV